MVQIPFSEMYWNPKGYWKTYEPKNLSNTIPQTKTKSNLTMYTQNSNWKPNFILASDKFIQLQNQHQEIWSKLDDNIPFQVYPLKEEFIINSSSTKPNDRDNTFITSLPSTELKTTWKSSQTGQVIPNILQELSKCKDNSMNRPTEWNVLPGKSKYIIHNPTQKHPFTIKPQHKIVKKVINPKYCISMDEVIYHKQNKKS